MTPELIIALIAASGIGGAIAGTVPALVVWLTGRGGRKDATKLAQQAEDNRTRIEESKIAIEDDKIDISRVDLIVRSYQDLLEQGRVALAASTASAATAQSAADAALAEAAAYKREREELMHKVNEQEHALAETNEKLERLRTLFNTVIQRANVQLTADEKAEFEATKPTKRSSPRRPATT